MHRIFINVYSYVLSIQFHSRPKIKNKVGDKLDCFKFIRSFLDFSQTAYANIDISSHWCNFRGRKGVGGEWLDFVMLGCDAGDAKKCR